MRILVWLFRAFLFFSLFAFALNNQQTASVNWFFGHAWTAPLVIILLVAFASGTALGVLAMTPSWWHQRRQARQAAAMVPTTTAPSPDTPPTAPAIPDGI
jgi:lipopolysaccharide assembly protein A